MKKYEVSFRPLAEADLLRLYEYIDEASGLALVLLSHKAAVCSGTLYRSIRIWCL